MFYNPGRTLKQGVYVLSVKEKNGENNKGSRLDREGVYRVNPGLGRETFRRLFGPLPQWPPKGRIVEAPCDFTALDTLLPHPVYAWMGWTCVPNSSRETFEKIKPLIAQSYEYARENHAKRTT